MLASLVGAVFGRLTVVGVDTARSTPKRRYLHCACSCGGSASVYRSNLLSGKSNSCGCLARARNSECHTIHGYAHLPEYGIWVKLRHRCLNTNDASYARYGGRGISVCSRWADSFANFLKDMGRRPSPEHQLDRRDNDGPYSKKNCRWATVGEQARNRRSTRLLTYRGRTQCLSDWAATVGIRRETLAYRLNSGWSVARALQAPVR